MNICERRGIINPPNMSCRSLPIDNTRLTENPTDLLLKACHSTVSEIWGGIGHTTPPSAVLCLVTQSCPTLFVTLWTVAHQAPLSMGILQARILECVPCSPPGELPIPGIEPRSPTLQADSLLSEQPGKPNPLLVVSIPIKRDSRN